MRTTFSPLLALLLIGCALPTPPDRAELQQQALPHAVVPPAWVGPAAAGSVAPGWVGLFQDQQLDALVTEALQYNVDLGISVARVDQAAAYARAAGAALLPQVNALARGGGEMSGDNSGLTGWALTASWELDLWGRVRASRESASQQFAATEIDLEAARLSIAAAVARGWFTATEARMREQLARETVAAHERLLQLAADRQRVGLGDELDVAQGTAALQGARDQQRQARLAIDQSRRALELLLGRYPATELQTAQRFAPLALDVPAGLPSELLERRPDVLAAERRVAAAFNRVTEAKAARLPRLSLTAGVNSVSSDLFILKDRDNPVWSAGASLMAPLFTGGALKEQVEVRNAEQREAVARYASTAQRAFGEVEESLSSGIALGERQTLLKAQIDANERAVRLSEERYRVGSADLRGVLNQRLALYGTQQQMLRVQGAQRIERVNLLVALGGAPDA
ncbi:efflux transporter outer membrane subunit [Rivibacter subsaxonicus]|uniref:NodT family efflux transporter outer membrane factor (OMF) lipoprotein n=1 Tax=Rivibacter subsaxonicus TaxID=457575 RepID=A0A4Q7W0X5_9BURK|nr:efflux transporter outer membrane subunit [Rivibacter subsaxonicus]RZU02770.1 NodT family efflux transporter outer membrane factor (OMF) lipoprotein [Rivibacter subsaxonicus]